MNVRDSYKTRYGMDWPEDWPEHLIELKCWQEFRNDPYSSAQLLNPVSEHFLRACRMLFTPDQLVIHPWFERMAEAYTMERGILLLGAASSGKSHFTGLALLLDYLASPAECYACMVSTTMDQLLLRSLASSIEYLGHLKANGQFVVPFKYVAQKHAIVPDGCSDIQTQKAMVKGVAISEGSEQDAKASIIGTHLRRVRAACDEFENMGSRAKAFEAAQDNLAMCEDYKVVYCFNPQSVNAPGSQLAAPVGGWASLSLDQDEWRAANGFKVLRFDGLKSPGRKDPKKYPFLPNDVSINRILERNHNNEDSPGFWAFVRAWPTPQADERTVLTEQMIMAYKMRDKVNFSTLPTRIAALDPAFTSGGDDCTFVTALVGTAVDGTLTLCIDAVHKLEIRATDPRPVLEQIVDQTSQLLTEYGIPTTHLGVDDSGTQSVADAIAMRTGVPPYRCNFAARAPDIPVSAVDSTLCSKKYKNTVTWLYYTVREFGARGQIKGLPPDAEKQFCSRRMTSKQQPHGLESKAEAKKRIQRSPDDADAVAILAGLARQVLGLMPGGMEWRPAGDSVAAGFTGLEDSRIREYNNLASGYLSS